jgi:hypothetical protein
MWLHAGVFGNYCTTSGKESFFGKYTFKSEQNRREQKHENIVPNVEIHVCQKRRPLNLAKLFLLHAVQKEIFLVHPVQVHMMVQILVPPPPPPTLRWWFIRCLRVPQTSCPREDFSATERRTAKKDASDFAPIFLGISSECLDWRWAYAILYYLLLIAKNHLTRLSL